MVACPHCTAKFASAAEIEARWLQTHVARFHKQSTSRASGPFWPSITDKHAA